MKKTRILLSGAMLLLACGGLAQGQVVIQPLTEATSKETKLYSSVATSNFSSNLNITSLDIGAHFVALLQFDLSGLGALNAESVATLTLYSTGIGASGGSVFGGTVALRPILNAWRETVADISPAGAPLATYEAFYGAVPTLSFGSVVATQEVMGAGFYTWDITATVRAWKDGSLANNGLFIELTSPGGDIGFADVDSNPAIFGSAPSLAVVPEPGAGALLASAGWLLALRRRGGARRNQS